MPFISDNNPEDRSQIQAETLNLTVLSSLLCALPAASRNSAANPLSYSPPQCVKYKLVTAGISKYFYGIFRK